MNRIVYIGMDVHTSNYTLCSLDPGYGVEKDNYFAEVQFTNNFVTNVVNYVTNLKKKLKDCEFGFNQSRYKMRDHGTINNGSTKRR